MNLTLDKMKFNVPQTNISGIRANIYQRKPLVEPADVTEDTAAVTAPIAFQFNFDEFNLNDINVDYGNDVSAFYSKLNLGKLVVNADNINLQDQKINLNKILFENTTVAIRIGKTQTTELVKEQVKQETKQQASTGWIIKVNNIELNNNNIAFINDNEPVLKQGMDYSHIDAKGITLHADDFIFSNDSIGASITKGSLTEKSGFQIEYVYNRFSLYQQPGLFT